MKIIYCINSIRKLGGVERVTVVKANAIAEIPGNEVWVVVRTDDKSQEYTEKPSPKVNVVDLGVDFFPDGFPHSKVSYVLKSIKERKEYGRKLSAFLHRVNPDVVVSVGHEEFYVLPKIKGSWKLVRELHLPANYRMQLCKGEGVFRHITAVYGTIKDKFYYPKYDRVVTLTEWDKRENWKSCRNVAVMPNPVSFKSLQSSPLTAKRIISVGRLTAQKQFHSLLRSFSFVHRRHPDWVLEIVGDGELRDSIQKQIAAMNLEDCVEMTGRTCEVDTRLLVSSIFALSSEFEGFGLVILEAMECGVPVVSYDCRYGPSDIITDGEDGCLVPVNEEVALAEKICSLVENEELRHEMGKKAKARAKQYYPEVLAQRWMQLFNDF